MGEPVKPDRFDRLWQAFTGTLLTPIQPSRRVVRATFVALTLLAALLVFTPAIFVNDMLLDLFIPLDGAYRMAHGQWPHADFYTPIGSGYYALLGLASLLVGTGPKVVAVSSVLLAPLLAGAAWAVTRNRVPTPLRLAAVSYIAMLTFSPRTLGTSAISYLATYNKHGWALVCIVALGVLLVPSRRSKQQAVVEAVDLPCFFGPVFT